MRDGVQSAKRQDSVELSQHFGALTKISNMRNVIAHEYFGVDAELTWQVCQKSLPALEKQIKDIYDDFPQA
jgi:uncharacterized protein with HEPN domain